MALTDIERNKSRRLQFLRAVYNLADGTSGHGVGGADVAARVGLDFEGDEFRGLAYFHQKEGNTQNLETNVGRLIITPVGIEEVERSMTPALRQDTRNRLLRAIYDLSGADPSKFVYWHDIAPRLGWDSDNPEHLNEALAMADYLANSELITIEVDEGTIYRITAGGIDVVEGNKPEPQPTQQFTFNAPAYGVFGSQRDFTFEQVIHDLDRQVVEHGGEDKEALRLMVEEIRRVLETQDSISKGKFERWSELANKHAPWLLGPLGSLLVNYAFGP